MKAVLVIVSLSDFFAEDTRDVNEISRKAYAAFGKTKVGAAPFSALKIVYRAQEKDAI